jgi:hypothetical protein
MSKADANDALSNKSIGDAQLELATFINALPVETACTWRDLIPIRKRLKGAGWLKRRDLQEIYDWALRNRGVEPVCDYLIKHFKP